MPIAWSPSGAEERLRSARDAGDLPAFLIALTRTEVLLLESDDGTAAWAVTDLDGQTCLVAFTSPAALEAAGREQWPVRRVTFTELAAGWPDPACRLALNPGVWLETFLESQTVLDVAGLAAQPANEIEARLARALDTGDVEAYIAVLMSGDVVLPWPDGVEGADLTGRDLPWFRMPVAGSGRAREPGFSTGPDDARPAVVFTSVPRWLDVAGEQPCARAPFIDVVDAWPDGPDGPGLLVDPGLAHGSLIEGVVMHHLHAEVRELAHPAPGIPGRLGSTEGAGS